MFFKTQKTKSLKRIFSFLTAFVMMLFTIVSSKPYIAEAAATSVSQLKLVGTQLSDSNNNPIQLKGMSSHGLQWYGDYLNYDSIKYLRDNWGSNVVRAAMYTDEGGYISNPEALKSKVKEIVDAAIDLNMYVIIDWHVLNDRDPNKYKTQAKAFFEEMARTYGNTPNVIYEICNEPNSGADWSNSIKPYADYIIPAIRAIDPDNIIIVGTSTWSQDVDIAANDQLSYSNIMYACHFYAGSHGQFLRDKINTALSKGAPVFVTEWGTSDASGNGGPFLNESQTWIDYMNEKKISWCNWSLCDKWETSAALKSGASTRGGWSDSDLSTSGLFIKKNIDTRNSNTNTGDTIVAAKVNTPSFSLADGTYTSAQNVSLNCSTNGAVIHYTTDGTNPTSSSPVYTNAFNVSKTMTIKAIAVKNGMTDSDIAAASYTINVQEPSIDDSKDEDIQEPSVDDSKNDNVQEPSVDDSKDDVIENPSIDDSKDDNNIAADSSVEITYAMVSDWGVGANVQVTIKNNGSTPINGWTLNWTQPSNVSINNMWTAVYSKNNSTVTAKDCGYNGYIAANGGTQSFGFTMNYSGSNVKPADFKLNGSLCTVK